MATNSICLPPGFRFHPTDEELVGYYLNTKVHGHKINVDIIPEVDIYQCEPGDLVEKSYLASEDLRWYFFCPRTKKYSNGSRTNRATHAGYWKSTGKDRKVTSSSGSGQRTTGTKKTLVFYRGRAPCGQRTDWIMHEYKLEKRERQEASIRDAFVLCCVFKKKRDGIGRGTKRDEIKSSSIHSKPKGSSQFRQGRKEAEDGKEDSNEQLPQSSQVDIDKWVEMLMDEPDRDDQYSNLDLAAPSDELKKINYLDEEAPPLQQTSECACPPLMAEQRIPINRNFPVAAFVHGCQSPISADGSSEYYTVLEELLSTAQTA